jgi:hypothetical protein
MAAKKYPRTLAAVAIQHHCTRQRVHQLVQEHGWDGALIRLRARKIIIRNGIVYKAL